jgi:GNAT superfamily N-acetyltransferase
MAETLTIRRARPADLAAVDALLAESYARLIAADYPPSVLVTAVPLIARADPALLASGRYFVAETGGGRIVAAGGWSGSGSAAQLRHVVTDHRLTRRGIGRRVVSAALADAAAAGVRRMDCLATHTAVPFYAALGFAVLGPVEVPLRPGIAFPAVRMQRPL